MGWLQAREDYKRDHTPAAYQEAAREDVKRACVGSDPVAVFECVNEKAEASHEQAHDEEDLTAQQRAASSALGTTILSFFALLLSGVGVVYVKRTLDATLTAVEDTGKATTAVQEANEIAREAIIVQDRAWLAVQVRLSKQIRLEGSPPEIRVDTEIKVTNIGTNPARNIGVDMHLIETWGANIWDRQRAFADEFEKVPPKHWIPGGTLFKNEQFVQPWGIGSGHEALKNLRDRIPGTPLLLALVGCVQYQLPGSEKIHQTGFALELCKATYPGRVIFFEKELPVNSSLVRLVDPVGGHSNIT